MDFPIERLGLDDERLSLFSEIPDPPKEVWVRGDLGAKDAKRLAVVGSRKYTTYGKQVVDHLISGLRGYKISIVSGLALGIDGLAHHAALAAGLHTIAVPGSGLNDDVLYPRSHRGLAARILESGGAHLSEFEPAFRATPWSFPQRNRIMAGLSHAVLVIEATEKSGTLITARLAVDYNRELLVVPGSIFSSHTKGSHQFLKLGAAPVTCTDDILEALHIEKDANHEVASDVSQLSDEERRLLALLTEPKDKDVLIRESGLATTTASILLMQLELSGHIAIEQHMVRRLQ